MWESMAQAMTEEWVPYPGMMTNNTQMSDWSSYSNMDASPVIYVGADERDQKLPLSVSYPHAITHTTQADVFSTYPGNQYGIPALASSTMSDEFSTLTSTHSIPPTRIFNSTSPTPMTYSASETSSSLSPASLPSFVSNASPVANTRQHPRQNILQASYAHHPTLQSNTHHRRRRSKLPQTSPTLPLASTALVTKSASFSGPSSSSGSSSRRPRLPHTEIERKYRQGLNSELDRLRRTIPTLASRDMEEPRPSKATILASAIKYIQGVENERDELKREVARLRALATTGRAGG